MVEYKRLTDKKVKGATKRYLRIDKDYICDAYDIVSEEHYDFVEMILNRLAELEDKIENGTLIELPCKVGGKFYEIDMIYGEYHEHEVAGFSVEDDELIILDYIDNRYNASEVYFTKTEAEAKLKELKGEV